jgi:hypothetical protein
VYGTVNGKDGVFRSLDFGKKWQDITPNLDKPEPKREKKYI